MTEKYYKVRDTAEGSWVVFNENGDVDVFDSRGLANTVARLLNEAYKRGYEHGEGYAEWVWKRYADNIGKGYEREKERLGRIERLIMDCGMELNWRIEP